MGIGSVSYAKSAINLSAVRSALSTWEANTRENFLGPGRARSMRFSSEYVSATWTRVTLAQTYLI
jgi:hypothetical protein